MRLIPKYYNAGLLNKGWVRDRDINGTWGYRNFKTGQFRTTLPNSQEAQQQEQIKRNNAVLRTYSANRAKYNTERATKKNHSDETFKKHISKPQIVADKSGNMSIVYQNELAPGEDSAQLNTFIEEQIPIFKGMKLAAGLGKLALSKMGQNSLSHWARNSLLNEAAGNLTTKMATPLAQTSEVPLEDGFVYRTFTPSHGGWVKDGKVYNRSYGLGDVRIQNGKYYSVRQAHFNNPDKLWWDTSGHNSGEVVQVTNKANTQTLQDAVNNGFNLNWGAFNKGYRLSDPIETNKVITYKRDPISGAMIPSVPGKVVTNKQTPSEIFQLAKEAPLQENVTPNALSQRIPLNSSEAIDYSLNMVRKSPNFKETTPYFSENPHYNGWVKNYGQLEANNFQKLWGDEITRRAEAMGNNMQEIQPITIEGNTIVGTPRTLIQKQVSKPVNIVSSDDVPINVGG